MKKSDELKRSLQGVLSKASEFTRSLTVDTMNLDENKTKEKNYDNEIALLQRQITLAEQDERLALTRSEIQKETEEADKGNVKNLSGEALHRKLFIAYVRGAEMNDLSKEEKMAWKEIRQRGQTIGDSAKGGITTPEFFSNQLIKALKDSSGAVEIINILNTGTGNPIHFPKADDINGIAVPIAEATRPSDDEFAFERVTLNAHKFSSKIFTVSNELITDSVIDIEAYMVEAMRMRFDRAMNYYFTQGTALGDYPLGFAALTSGYAQIELANDDAISWEELVDIVQSVDPAYMRKGNARWTFNQNTEGKLRKMKDGDGLPIWQMGDITKGVPSTLLGFPYVINNDMPSFNPTASPDLVTSRVPIAFGDFKAGYTGRIVSGAAIRRSDELYMETDEVGFVGFMRFDGKPMDTRAVKVATLPTA